ncbi:MAG: class I adenylate-forming enzyme family protein [Rhodomicrobium sp.]
MSNDRLGYQGDLPPPAFNMARYCLRAARAAHHKPALLVVHDAAGRDVETWRYGDLEQAVLRAACVFRARYKLPARSRILIRLRNRTSYAIAFFGAIAGGFVPVPASPDLTERELSFMLDDAEAAAIVLDDTLPHGDFPPGLTVIREKAFEVAVETGPMAQYAPTLAGDPAFLIYTSGTTANPKGVLHAHRSAWGRRPMYQGWYGITPGDRLMHAGSFNWTYTMGTGLTDPWANGATAIVYTGEKDPALWPRLMRAFDVTIFAGVPGVYRQMLKYGSIGRGGLPALRHGLTAGEALPNALADEWEARTRTRLYEALGQSELSTYLSSSPSVPRKPGTVGRPQAGRCVAILDENGGDAPLAPGAEGLIAVHRSDPGLMLGYWRRPEEEAEVFRGEWFAGGDAGAMDGDGYVTHRGRHNDLMNAGGFRVSPAEVERELAKHPGVADIAVAEVQVGDGVSIIAAFVVLHQAKTGVAAELDALAGRTLAAYKRPKDYIVVESLPKTSNGKIKRAELRAGFRSGARPA